MIYIVEINFICLFILLFTLASVYSREKQVSMIYYVWSIVSGAICVASDIVFAFLEYGSSDFLRSIPYLNFSINFIYYVFDVVAAFFWFMYAEHAIDSELKNKKSLVYIAFIPVVINTALSIASYWTGTLFWINENNLYERGSYFYINTLICYLYTIIASVHALIRSFTTPLYYKKSEYRTIAAYIIFPFILGTIQIIYPEIPTVCVGMAFPILFVHIRMQDLMISTDYLTNMNNRNQLLRYIASRIKNEPDNLYLFMMDMDKFKQINDVYGHTEGDNALVAVADRLKEVARDFGGIMARYGGDEFSYATEVADEAELTKIKEAIAAKMEEESKKHPYRLALSIGCSKYQTGQKVTDFISASDEMLYQEKRRLKREY